MYNNQPCEFFLRCLKPQKEGSLIFLVSSTSGTQSSMTLRKKIALHGPVKKHISKHRYQARNGSAKDRSPRRQDSYSGGSCHTNWIWETKLPNQKNSHIRWGSQDTQHSNLRMRNFECLSQLPSVRDCVQGRELPCLVDCGNIHEFVPSQRKHNWVAQFGNTCSLKIVVNIHESESILSLMVAPIWTWDVCDTVTEMLDL